MYFYFGNIKTTSNLLTTVKTCTLFTAGETINRHITSSATKYCFAVIKLR